MEGVKSPSLCGKTALTESSQLRETKQFPRSRQSILPLGVSPFPTRAQLVPYCPNSSLDSLLTDIERDLVNNTKFDALDLAFQDLDFEDIFTYGKPQLKLARVVEVTLSKRKDRRPSNFSHSYYSAAITTSDNLHTAKGCDRGLPSTKKTGRTG